MFKFYSLTSSLGISNVYPIFDKHAGYFVCELLDKQNAGQELSKYQMVPPLRLISYRYTVRCVLVDPNILTQDTEVRDRIIRDLGIEWRHLSNKEKAAIAYYNHQPSRIEKIFETGGDNRATLLKTAREKSTEFLQNAKVRF